VAGVPLVEVAAAAFVLVDVDVLFEEPPQAASPRQASASRRTSATVAAGLRLLPLLR